MTRQSDVDGNANLRYMQLSHLFIETIYSLIKFMKIRCILSVVETNGNRIIRLGAVLAYPAGLDSVAVCETGN